MATRYWVGGGSSTNANATGNTNWSASSGGANNASVPTTGDLVIFDAASGSGTCVWNFAVSQIGFDAHAFTGTITHNTSITITISAASTTAIRLPATGTYTAASATALFTITATSGTVDITSNGKRFGGLTVNGAGHTTRLLDALRVDAFASSTLTLTSGTFNANNFDVTLSQFAGSGSTTRTLTMGSGTWSLGLLASASATIWTLATVTNLTFNKDTANIVVKSNGLASARTFQGGGRTYNDLTLEAHSGEGMFIIGGANTFANLSVGQGNQLNLPASATNTVSNAFTITGAAASPTLIASSSPGLAATISVPSGAVSLDWCGLRDITGTGGATFTADSSLDFGNNTGWTINPPTGGGGSLTADDVWNEPTAGNTTAGTFGAQLKTVLDAVSTLVTAIDAKTTNLPSDPADASVIAGRFDTLDTSIGDLPTNAELATALGTADDAVLAQIALVKAKTDNLPSDPADATAFAALEAHGDANWGGAGSAPTASEVADEVETRTLMADIRKVNNIAIDGAGTEGNPFGPA